MEQKNTGKKDYGIRIIVFLFVLAIIFLLYQRFGQNLFESKTSDIPENIIDIQSGSSDEFSQDSTGIDTTGQNLSGDQSLSGQNNQDQPKNNLTGDINEVRQNYDKIQKVYKNSQNTSDNGVNLSKNNFDTGNSNMSGNASKTDKTVKQTAAKTQNTQPVNTASNANDFDLETDTSYTKYVGKNHPFNDVKYSPNDLTKIYSTKTIKIINDKGTGYQQLRKVATQNIQKMADDFYAYFKKPLVIYSSYRSYDYQKGIDQSCKDSGRCAKEGESEHQLGLAVDLREATNKDSFLKNYQKEYEWLQKNAYKYGFTQSYQKGASIDGYHEEPWHWRYLGFDLAKKLYTLGITFSQYYKGISK